MARSSTSRGHDLVDDQGGEIWPHVVHEVGSSLDGNACRINFVEGSRFVLTLTPLSHAGGSRAVPALTPGIRRGHRDGSLWARPFRPPGCMRLLDGFLKAVS